VVAFGNHTLAPWHQRISNYHEREEDLKSLFARRCPISFHHVRQKIRMIGTDGIEPQFDEALHFYAFVDGPGSDLQTKIARLSYPLGCRVAMHWKPAVAAGRAYGFDDGTTKAHRVVAAGPRRGALVCPVAQHLERRLRRWVIFRGGLP